MSKENIDIRYRIYWVIGGILSSLLYYSGITWVYLIYRKRVLKRFRTIVLTYHRIRDDDIDPYFFLMRCQIINDIFI
ncbi:MAG: hypothetical protein SVZ03_09570 [Spirochaetota bacterium]|nr:hypothetical protein [Spirochaetota bacterium]